LFGSSSRYYSCDDAIAEIDYGTFRRQVPYKKRRILPKGEELNIFQEVTVRAGDRLDLISNHVFGDPQQFWRICDANDAMYPPELTSLPGNVLKIPAPWS
jgi:nucleoid-associated protein YgaU